ncbi:MAG: hypothetical protein JXA41_10680 [Deltaproteobacteria bacterium]|nr:hypothetical protein [Deltaproteobacteria bacterium]
MDKKSSKPLKKSLIIILIIALLIILGLGIYTYLDRMGEQPAEKPTAKEKGPDVREPVVTVPPEVQAPNSGPKPEAVDICKENWENLQNLFAYLDQQDYIASRQLPGGTFAHFKVLLARLINNPPFVQRETDDLMRILQNKTHFFRELGKKNTLLLRDILRREGDIMESSFAILYEAMTLQEQCKAHKFALQAPLKDVYPYAVFFLNTLGGSSYLIRRDSRLRMLTQYYSLLILHQANQHKLNKLGLDIRPSLEVLIRDLKSTTNLSRKETYIETLKSIRAEY